MTNKRRNSLKILIRKVELDKPSLNFTGLVMEEVMAKEGAVINPALKSILKRNGVEHPTKEFTHVVVARAEALDIQTTYRSFSPKIVWFIIIFGITFLALYFGISEYGIKSPGGLTLYFIDVGNVMSTILRLVNSVPSLYIITIISMSGLLMTDYLIRTIRQSREAEPKTSS